VVVHHGLYYQNQLCGFALPGLDHFRIELLDDSQSLAGIILDASVQFVGTLHRTLPTSGHSRHHFKDG